MTRARRPRAAEAGFTMIEVMVAVLLTAIAVIGIVGLYRVQTASSAFSRRSTEAAVLAEDKMEVLRTMAVPVSSVTPEANLDSRGIAGTGPFQREWTVTTTAGVQHELLVRVTWNEDGTARAVVLRSVRGI